MKYPQIFFAGSTKETTLFRVNNMAAASHVFLPLWLEIRMFDNRESSRFPFLHRQYSGMSNIRNMERQETIHFEGIQAKPQVDFREWINRKSESVKKWLNGRSVFYSKIAEFPVSRKLVIRINLVTLCLLAAAIAVEQQPFVAVTAGLCAGWIVYRIQKGEKRPLKK